MYCWLALAVSHGLKTSTHSCTVINRLVQTVVLHMSLTWVFWLSCGVNSCHFKDGGLNTLCNFGCQKYSQSCHTRGSQYIHKTRYIFWVTRRKFGITVKLTLSNLYSRKNGSVQSFCWIGDPEEWVYLHEIMDMTKINCRAIFKIFTKKEKTPMESTKVGLGHKVIMFLNVL